MNELNIPVADFVLRGILELPSAASGIVLFVHGSGSSRLSTRNQYVAHILNNANMATLLFDLLTPEEEQVDDLTREHRFNIPLLAERLIATTQWILQSPATKHLNVGYFGASTGAAAALVAAAVKPQLVKAIVSRGGRPDLAGDALGKVKAPTLLIVGGDDGPVIGMNEAAGAKMTCPIQLEIVPHATHLFEEAGTLEKVAVLAQGWFKKYL